MDDAPQYVEWLPCSREQEGLWLLELKQGRPGINNLSVALELSGSLDLAAFRRAVRRLVERHPALRTEFAVREGRLVRRERALLDSETVPVGHESGPADADRLARLSNATLDILRWPQYRLEVLSPSERSHMMHMLFHHCTLDGGSLDIATRDLLTLYASEAGGTPPALPALEGVDYGRYVAVERAAIASLHARASVYWTSALDELRHAVSLPDPGGRRSVRSGPSTAFEISIARDEIASLREYARGLGTTLFITMLAVLQVLQFRYAGGEEAPVATGIALGTRPVDMRDSIGMFATEAPLVTFPSAEMSFAGFLAQLTRRARELFELRAYPFAEVVRELARVGGSATPRPSATMTSIKYERPLCDLPGASVASRRLLPSLEGRSPFAVWLVEDDRTALTVRFDVDESALPSGLGSRIPGHFRNVLAAIQREPQQRLAELELMAGDERMWTLRTGGRRGPVPQRDRTAHELVERRARRDADATAVVCEDRSLSYRELNSRANQLAHRLRRLGIGAGVPVAVLAERSIELVAAMLGTLKAGGAYVPLDPAFPEERLRLVVGDTRAPVVVCQEHLVSRVPPSDASVLPLDAAWREFDGESTADPHPSAVPTDVAYILYTSGSSGVPKGAAIEHRGLANLMDWHRRAYAVGPGDRSTMLASVSFDASIWETMPYLAAGATIVVWPDRDFANAGEVTRRLARDRITLCYLPTALAELFLRAEHHGLSLRVLHTGGDLLRERPDGACSFAVVNHYGPTETTIVVTSGRVDADGTDLPSIGRPIDNVTISILDARGEPVPVGVAGEIHVGGIAVGRGYLDRPTLTAERFVRDPLAADDGRLYRTGDLGRWRGDGAIDFLGRRDRQVKIHGFRIEPGEIEAVLARHPKVRTAAVVARSDLGRDLRLVAYVVPSGLGDPSERELRDHLATMLPPHMAPSAFVVLDELPSTSTGKIDRAALPRPDRDTRSPEVEVAPRNEVEATIASIWCDVLDLESIGVTENFFELGGDSLLATQAMARIRAALERDLPLGLLFAHASVEQLAAEAEQRPQLAQLSRSIARAERVPLR